jgi:hypothetical protein
METSSACTCFAATFENCAPVGNRDDWLPAPARYRVAISAFGGCLASNQDLLITTTTQ